jgi:hypothetical protein
MDILMNLQPHGWLDVLIRVDDMEINIPVSFLSDAISEIASKMSIIDQDIDSIIITLQTEPGEYRFMVSKISNQLSLFRVFEMSDNFSSEAIEEGTLLLSQEIKTIRLVRIIHRELTKMKDMGLDEYKDRWSSEFPIEAYKKLGEVIKHLRNQEAKSK